MALEASELGVGQVKERLHGLGGEDVVLLPQVKHSDHSALVFIGAFVEVIKGDS